MELGCNEIFGSELKFCYNQDFVTGKVLYTSIISFNVISNFVQKTHEANSGPEVIAAVHSDFIGNIPIFPEKWPYSDFPIFLR